MESLGQEGWVWLLCPLAWGSLSPAHTRSVFHSPGAAAERGQAEPQPTGGRSRGSECRSCPAGQMLRPLEVPLWGPGKDVRGQAWGVSRGSHGHWLCISCTCAAAGLCLRAGGFQKLASPELVGTVGEDMVSEGSQKTAAHCGRSRPAPECPSHLIGCFVTRCGGFV